MRGAAGQRARSLSGRATPRHMRATSDLSCRDTAQQAPCLHARDRRIQPGDAHGESAGLIDPRYSLELIFGRPATIGFELKRKHSTALDHDNVGYSSHNPEALEDCRLDRLALAAIGNVERDKPRNPALPYVLEYGALDHVFGP